MVYKGLLQNHFSKTFVKISAVYGNLSCHSNESTLAMTKKNKIYVEANVMNIYAKFQLHPPYGF